MKTTSYYLSHLGLALFLLMGLISSHPTYASAHLALPTNNQISTRGGIAVKAWENLFSNHAWRTNTGYLTKVSRYTDNGIDIVEDGAKIKAKTADGLEIGELDVDALEEVAENALKVKGKFSGRHFDPDKAGGVIIRKSWQDVTINQAGIDDVITHTSRFDDILGENALMIDRLKKIKNGEIPITDYDKRYYTHELEEYARYKNLGIADGVDPGNEVWNNAHSATLEVYSITDEASLIFKE